ncbi:MAG: cadherin domain-containing protein, partial [Hyphomicrobiaceae bacterium]|nr:cadherin domain-containing protein [Hyphomicrobiaceae bacterium]
TVANTNEGPTVTSAAAVSVAENTAGTVYTATATDPDAGTTLTYSLSGADAALFNIDAATGAVSFKNAPDSENAQDAGANNVYDVKVTASDGTNATTQDVAITVTNTNEGPTVTSSAAVSVAENTAGTVYTATATDPDAGTTLTYSLSGADAALFNIDATTGAVSFKGAPNYENPADAGGNNIYDVKVTASDGTTATTQDVAITVTNTNEGPTVTSAAAVSVAENTAGTVYTATATDPDAGTTLTYSLSGTDAALFNINATTGAVSFKGAPNYESPADAGGNNIYDVKVTASDGTTTATKDVAITVTNVTTGTSITSPDSVLVAENTAGTVYTVTSNNESAAPVKYSLTGTDAALFNIDENTGAISFKANADYESAQDAGRNNIYDVVVHASTTGAGANMLINGSFEADQVAAGNFSVRSSTVGWTAIAGGKLELQHGVNGTATHGTQFIDLDAQTATDGVFQDVQTAAGQKYEVAVDTMLRNEHITSSTSHVEILWNGVVVGTISPGQDWSQASFEVVGTGGADRLTIREPASEGGDGSGALIDNVRLFIPPDSGNSTSQDLQLSVTNIANGFGFGTSLNETIVGAGDADTIYGMGGTDTLQGGAGDDTLIGGTGADVLEGGTGRDTASYATSTAAVSVDLGNNTGSGGDAAGDTFRSVENLTGSDHNDTLRGTTKNNVLSGGAGNDTLFGDWGADTLIGGAGADALDGGNGLDDAASYATSNAAVSVNLLTGVATGGHAAGDTFANIEHLIGSMYGDTLTGNAGNNILEGGFGADALDGGDGIDAASYAHSSSAVNVNLRTGVGTGGDAWGDTYSNIENVIGSDYNDTITGNATVNALYGGYGNDILIGGGGADIIDGGVGNDTASYAGAAAAVTANLATGGTAGEATGDTYFGVENLTGSSFNDTLTGDAGDNIIAGGAGADTMNGGLGNDTLDYAASNAGVTINLGTGAASGGHATGDVFSNFENINGSAFNDTLTGDAGANMLFGGAGIDTLRGGAGNDTLTGGVGNDTLYGDAGSDLFIMNAGHGTDTISGGAGGGWLDALELRDSSGASYANGSFPGDWTMVLTTGQITGTNADSLDLSQDAAGYIENSDGTRVNFSELEQIRW